MTAVAAIAAAAVVHEVVDRRRPRWAGWAAAMAAAMALSPPLALAMAVAAGVIHRHRRLMAERAEEAAAAADVVLLGELVSLGLGAGLTFSAALAAAAPEVAPPLRLEVEGLLRRSRRAGLSSVLTQETGRARRLYRLAARALATGAPLVAAVDAFVHDLRAEERARRLASARKLPVRLLVPLALLILPGFVLMTVGPALVTALERLAVP